MKFCITRSVCLTLVLLGGWAVAADTTSKKSPPSAAFPSAVTDFIDFNCVDCHGDDFQKGNFRIDTLGADLTDAKRFKKWVRVYDRVAGNEMPPAKVKPPSAKEKDTFLKAMGNILARADRHHKQVVLRRLTRFEYTQTIQALLSVRMDLSERLPDDRASRTYDTIGDTLTISDAQVEAYYAIANDAVSRFLAQREAPKRLRIRQPALKLVSKGMVYTHKILLPLDDGGVVVFGSKNPRSWLENVKVQTPGTYRIRITAKAYQSDKPVTLKIPTKSGERYFDIPPTGRTVEVTDYLYPGDRIYPQPFGTIPNAHVVIKRLNQPLSAFDGAGLYLGEVEVEGPLETWPTRQYQTLLGDIDLPKATLEDAKRVVDRLLPRAFRRPSSQKDRALIHAGMQRIADAGRPTEDALRWGMAATLCHPRFLYLHEPAHRDGERIDDYAFATRLSYFLWSSPPDERLTTLAESGRLREPNVLRAEVERMLKDAKAEALTLNFADQWLRLNEIDATQPDEKIYPEFDAYLRSSMIQETRLFFEEVLRSNRSVLEFVDSPWLIVNERLAKHYGLVGVTGDAFRKVAIPTDHPRGGLATQASILKLTANGINTSPVPRGLWVLESLLGEHLPPPPDVVAAVEPDVSGAKTIRDQLDAHRHTEACAACHRKIDPPGFALENFNAIGGWDTHYRPLSPQAARKPRRKVDAAGVTADGIKFDGVNEFKLELLKQPELVYHAVAEHLLTYGVGRKMSFSDRAELRELTRQGKANSYSLRELVHQIVRSDIFNEP